MNFAKFLRTPLFTEHLWWLLLNVGGQISQNVFPFSEVTQADILKEIKFVKNKKATTFSTIPPTVLIIS